MDLRENLLSAGRGGKQNKRFAGRHENRPAKLFKFLGEHVRGAAARGGIWADERDAPSPGPAPPRPSASLDLTRAFSKTRSPSHRHRASHRAALAASVSLPR